MRILELLINEIGKKTKLIKKDEIKKGLISSQYSLGFALVTISWLMYIRLFKLPYLWADIVTLIGFLLFSVYAFELYRHFKKAIYLKKYAENTKSKR
tara:strand:- start:2617 stop:2907 length:291 start_codon:yes stop_codon:yes gene_type:complete